CSRTSRGGSPARSCTWTVATTRWGRRWETASAWARERWIHRHPRGSTLQRREAQAPLTLLAPSQAPGDMVAPVRAIQITEFGGPEVLVLREIDEPQVPDGFVPVEVCAAGINWADTHQAENSYLAPAELPLVPGAEVVGTAPDGTRGVAMLNTGRYADRAVVHPSLMWEVPDGVSDGQALGLV